MAINVPFPSGRGARPDFDDLATTTRRRAAALADGKAQPSSIAIGAIN